MPMMDIGQLNNINRYPFIGECEQKTHAPFLYFYNHYTLACKYRTNIDNSVLSVDETFKS